MSTAEKGVSVKVFLGMMVTPDHKARLDQNKEWSKSSIGESKTRKLRLIDYHNKEYLGFYIDKPITVNELMMAKLYCLDQLKLLFPDLQAEAFKFTIFPQIFIA